MLVSQDIFDFVTFLCCYAVLAVYIRQFLVKLNTLMDGLGDICGNQKRAPTLWSIFLSPFARFGRHFSIRNGDHPQWVLF